MAIVRLVLSLALHFHWPIHQLDVKNTFLHGVISEQIFMEQPRGFIDPNYPNHVCLLRKAIYGLQQAPHAWFSKFSQFLLTQGFTMCLTDNLLFVRHAP